MQSTKKLLSIRNLKKYFPVAKTSFFQKNQLYVRANEDISLDIYEGETIGVVGESGCGKSTLGRVLLQLYSQTAGNTMYYGTTLDDTTPAYVFDTLRHLSKYTEKHAKAVAKVAELNKKVEAVGGEEKADFYLLQERNLAVCEEQTCMNAIGKIIGGFYVTDEGGKGVAALLHLYEENTKRNKLLSERHDLELDRDHAAQLGTPAGDKKAKSLDGKLASLQKEIDAVTEAAAKRQAEVDALRAAQKDNEEFQKYEGMRDHGIDLARLTYNEMRLLRKDLQIIFQDPYSSLNPRMTIGQTIEEGLVTHKFFKRGSKQMQSYVFDVMNQCGLQNYMYNRYPHQFSGGQRQRVAIARALAVQPKFVVCDECVSALDVSIQSQIINLLQELKEKQHLTYMFISHDLSVVRYISDRICVMYLGNVVELAPAETIFTDPRHPYTVALLSSIPTTDPDSASRERIILEGNIPSPIKPPDGCKFHTRCFMACEQCKRVPPPLREVEPGHFCACHFADQRKLDENGNFLFTTKTTTAER